SPHLPGNTSPRGSQPINRNGYATKKSVAESMLDVALFTSGAARLKALEQGPSSRCHATLVTLISISLLLQVVVGILLVVILWLNLNKVERQWRLDQPNSAATTLVFLTVGISVSIIAFGAHKAGFLAARASRNLL
uniref:Ninjurin 2 n=1 Tax=Microcebus murinus TaxID=30608 RepID=A0A8C5VNH7_MICMU